VYKAHKHVRLSRCAHWSNDDEDIDYSEYSAAYGQGKFIQGKFYRPVKKTFSIRIDADVLAGIKSEGKDYQTRINGYLREAMRRSTKRLLLPHKPKAAS
jgi:uncharacterized protein (DUF4415 family)